MLEQARSEAPRLSKPNLIVMAALFVYYLSTLGRTLILTTQRTDVRAQSGLILALELSFIGLFSIVLFTARYWSANARRPWFHIYLAIQCALISAPLLLSPELDFVTTLFTLLCFQATLWLTGWPRWVWIGVFIALTAWLLIVSWGFLRGLGLGLTTLVGEIVLVAYVLTDQELAKAQAKSRAMLLELQEKHRQLQLYTGQVEELAAIEERNRLARELHDSVSQTIFSIILNTRSAQLLLSKNPSKVRAQLEQLQALVQAALAEMRSLITQLRQPAE